MLHIGHNGSLGKLDGAIVPDNDPRSWGNLVPKAEYLAQFGKIRAWEIYVLPHQLRPQALEQLAEAMIRLSSHQLFADLEWLSFHFPSRPQSHHISAEINQEQWRPFYQLLQVLDRFQGAKRKNLNFHVLATHTLPQVWKLEKKHDLNQVLDEWQERADDMLLHAYRLRDHLNPKLGLTVENNPPYDADVHGFHLAGLFPDELKRWSQTGIDFCLDIQHASLVQWYREHYGYDGPIPPMNALKHRCSSQAFSALHPTYIHAAGAPNTPESLHVGATIGSTDDDINWIDWMAEIKLKNKDVKTPIIIELVDGHLPQNWAACQASATYLSKLI